MLIVQKPFSTIRYIINKYKNSVENLPRSGRSKFLNKREKRGILTEVRNNPKFSD